MNNKEKLKKFTTLNEFEVKETQFESTTDYSNEDKSDFNSKSTASSRTESTITESIETDKDNRSNNIDKKLDLISSYMNGECCLNFGDGSHYMGEMKCDVITGKGTFVSEKHGIRTIKTGNFVDGVMCGKGALIRFGTQEGDYVDAIIGNFAQDSLAENCNVRSINRNGTDVMVFVGMCIEDSGCTYDSLGKVVLKSGSKIWIFKGRLFSGIPSKHGELYELSPYPTVSTNLDRSIDEALQLARNFKYSEEGIRRGNVNNISQKIEATCTILMKCKRKKASHTSMNEFVAKIAHNINNKHMQNYTLG